MYDLKVFLTGMSLDLARRCSQILKTAAVDRGLDERGGEEARLVLAVRPEDISPRDPRVSDNPAVIGLASNFDPETVNRLLAAGAHRVIPQDQIAEMLLGCVYSIFPTDSQPFRSVEVIQLHGSDEPPAPVRGADGLGASMPGLSHLPALVVVLSMECTILFFNQRSEQLSGYNRSEVEGRRLNDVFLLPEDNREVLAAMQGMKLGDPPMERQNIWLTKQGESRQLRWSNQVVKAGDSAPVIVSIGLDVTEDSQSQEAANAAAVRFDRLFQSSPTGIALLRFIDRSVIEANRYLLKILGRERADVIGKPVVQIGLFPEQGVDDLLNLVARQGPLVNYEWRVTGRGKRSVHLLVSMDFAEWGREMVVVVIAQEITDRRLAEEKLHRLSEDLERRVLEKTRALEAVSRELKGEVEYRKAIEGSSQRINQIIWELPEVIAMCEIGGRMLYINKAGRKLYNLTEVESVSHLSVYQYYPSARLDFVRRAVVPAVLSNGMWQGELELSLPDGEIIPVRQTILAHENQAGKIEFFSTIIHDITEEKMARDRIRQAYETEKAMGQMRASFFSMTSHQFRTPLSAILTSAELLEVSPGSWDEERRLRHIRIIQSQVQILNEMLNDIQDIGRLEMKNDDFQLGPVEICEIVDRCLDQCIAADGMTHAFQFDCREDHLFVSAAPRLIDRVVANLLSNAVKYSPPSTLVRARVYAQDRQAVIEVEDEGIGIAEKDLPLVFQPFFRGGNAGDVNGSGLGLVIVQRTLELIGGTVAIASNLGQGTRVEVRIPLCEGEV
jgi:PAS domain S-box-containing protein